MNADTVIHFLCGAGFIDQNQADDLHNDADISGQDIVQELINFGIFESRDQFYATIADQIGSEYMSLASFDPPQALL